MVGLLQTIARWWDKRFATNFGHHHPAQKKTNCRDLPPPPPMPPMVSSLDSKPGHEDHLKSRNAIPHTD